MHKSLFTDHVLGARLKDGLSVAWNGFQLFLKQIEDLVAGTPAQIPVNIANILIELKNVSYSHISLMYLLNFITGCF